MRLFYILLLLIMCSCSNAFAAAGKTSDGLKKASMSFRPCNTSALNVQTHAQPEQESIQKDFINTQVLKVPSSVCILLLCMGIIFVKAEILTTGAFPNKLKVVYGGTFKMLYPKHFFW